MTSISRASRPSSPAISMVSGEGVISASLTMRPSALETIFWLITRRSPAVSGVRCAAAA
jgi:hypothetical protein